MAIVGIPADTLRWIAAGKRDPSPSELALISSMGSVSLAWLRTGIGRYGTPLLPGSCLEASRIGKVSIFKDTLGVDNPSKCSLSSEISAMGEDISATPSPLVPTVGVCADSLERTDAGNEAGSAPSPTRDLMSRVRTLEVNLTDALSLVREMEDKVKDTSEDFAALSKSVNSGLASLSEEHNARLTELERIITEPTHTSVSDNCGKRIATLVDAISGIELAIRSFGQASSLALIGPSNNSKPLTELDSIIAREPYTVSEGASKSVHPCDRAVVATQEPFNASSVSYELNSDNSDKVSGISTVSDKDYVPLESQIKGNAWLSAGDWLYICDADRIASKLTQASDTATPLRLGRRISVNYAGYSYRRGGMTVYLVDDLRHALKWIEESWKDINGYRADWEKSRRDTFLIESSRIGPASSRLRGYRNSEDYERILSAAYNIHTNMARSL